MPDLVADWLSRGWSGQGWGATGQRRAAGYVAGTAAACSDGGPGHAGLGIGSGPRGSASACRGDASDRCHRINVKVPKRLASCLFLLYGASDS